MKVTTKFWIALGILIVLTPLGLFLPAYFKAGPAWGEWGTEELQKLIGYVPDGLAKLSRLWNAPMSDYAYRASEGKSMFHVSFEYIVSALAGVALTVLAALLIGNLLVKNNNSHVQK